MKVCSSLLIVIMLALIVSSSVVAMPHQVQAKVDKVPGAPAQPWTNGLFNAELQTGSYQRIVPSLAGLQQRGTISGQVVLPSGQQVNTRFRITVNGYRVSSLIAYTDNRGRFVIPNISDGTYTLEVDGDRNLFEPVTQEVRVTYGSHPGLVITLREKRTAVAKPASNVISAGELDQQVPEQARKEFEKGAELSQQGKIQDAIKRFKSALAIFPNYLMARNNLGVQHLKLGQWSDAVEQFRLAIEINAKALNPRQNIAIALIEQRKYEEAIEHLNHALSIDSSSPVAHLYAGIASLGVEEIEQAERELLLALSLGGSEYANAHFYLALVHIKKGERDSAKRELTSYLDKMPQGEKVQRARQLLEKMK